MSMAIVSRPRPTSRKQLPDYLSAEEVDGLLSVVDDVQARTLFLLEWRAGLRVSEALNLQVQDVNLRGDRPYLRVECRNEKKPRKVPVHRELLPSLDLFVRLRGKGPLFPNLSWTTAHHHLQETFVKAQDKGLVGRKRHCSNHTLRHSAARHWLANGIPVNVVNNWLGHSRLTSTMVYLELFSDPGDLTSQVR